jgi:tetratricopeptide (TPR) repeat protein
MKDMSTKDKAMNDQPPPENLRLRLTLLTGVVAAIVLSLFLWHWTAGPFRGATKSQTPAAPTYVGAAACAACHAKEANDWSHSHHALAMQQANVNTSLGNFNDARFAKDGVTSRFSKKDGKFYVRTDGPNGQLQDYELPYTFGVYPLQQYLAPFPGGRLQSLPIAWDSRTSPQSGQRWFHLYPNQKLLPTDPIHWTGRNQTWNYMCADCHSTNLRRNYNLASDGYATTWSDINVACESCHGPGSAHIAWGQAHGRDSYQSSDPADGLPANLKSPSGSWTFIKSTDATMHWQGSPRSRAELETCAPCHSRRRPITSQYLPGGHFLDAFVPNLLEEGVYFPDGQIQEEDYEYGSFVQSRMYHEGVTCSDCHNPHTGKLPADNMNSVCAKCHLFSKFDTVEHTHHKPQSPGALCVNCHMPTRTYMVIDARRDHSFRVPRPDFSLAYGTPNACTQCHTGKSAKWAADAVVKWYGPDRRKEPRFVGALDAGRRGLVIAERELASLIADSSQPGIARATALSLLPQYLTPASLPAVQAGLIDEDALVRGAAVRALEPLAPQQRVPLAVPLLTDPVRSVRIDTARLLAGTPPNLLQAPQKDVLDQALSELIASELATAERPENHVNLSLLYLQMGRVADAEAELHTALRLDPNNIPAMTNLADLCRVQQRDDEGQRWLEKAIALAPAAAEPIHALGLLEVRQKNYQLALTLLAKAASLQPGNTRYSYVYAIALQSSGQPDQAIKILQQTHKTRPADREVLFALISLERDKGDAPAAKIYAQQLVQLVPGDPQAKALLNSLH